jgi:hypothetical protein
MQRNSHKRAIKKLPQVLLFVAVEHLHSLHSACAQRLFACLGFFKTPIKHLRLSAILVFWSALVGAGAWVEISTA